MNTATQPVVTHNRWQTLGRSVTKLNHVLILPYCGGISRPLNIGDWAVKAIANVSDLVVVVLDLLGFGLGLGYGLVQGFIP